MNSFWAGRVLSLPWSRAGGSRTWAGSGEAQRTRETEKLQELITEVYDNFVAVVATGRSMEEERVRELATGEIFTARQGKETGLVDELLDFEQSLEWAAQSWLELEKNKARPRWLRPRRTMSERLTGTPRHLSVRAASPGARTQPADVRRPLLPGTLVHPWGTATTDRGLPGYCRPVTSRHLKDGVP